MDIEKEARKQPAKTRKMDAETTRLKKEVEKELEALKKVVKKGKKCQIQMPWFNSGDNEEMEEEGPLLLGKRRIVSYAVYKDVLEYYEGLSSELKQSHKMANWWRRLGDTNSG